MIVLKFQLVLILKKSIYKKTGKQKVDKQNRKQWKCKTISTNDWSSKDNAKKWRINLTETINVVNEKMGMTENFWEHRSFKEQGLDILPQIHLGEKASAMERAGIHTIRGDINRSIIQNNAIIMTAKTAMVEAGKHLNTVKTFAAMGAKKIADTVKNEILDMIHKVASLNKDKLNFPVIGTKYAKLISNRSELQSIEKAEDFVHRMKLTTFDEMKTFKQTEEQKYATIYEERSLLLEKKYYLESLLEMYKDYEPYIKYNKKRYSLKGKERKEYEAKHIPELSYYEIYRKDLKDAIRETDKKITASAWKKELAEIDEQLEKTFEPYAQTVSRLAYVEVLEHNKKELERFLANERNARNRHEMQKTKKQNKNVQGWE